MNVLITGANGSIGKHVCDYFKEQGCYVIGLGRNAECRCNCDEYVCVDMSSEKLSKLYSMLSVDKIDAIVHLAADVRHDYKAEILGNNCVGVQRLIELCVNEKIPVFVQLSSLPVIGTPNEHPITEAHSIKPPTLYHVSKRTQEMLADFASYTYGLRTVSFRICSPVGIGVNPKTIFTTFVRKAVNQEDLHLIGTGSRKQTYIHVRDTAQALYKAVCSNAQGIYNLASYNLVSNYELAKKCVELTNSSSKIIFDDRADPEDGLCWDVCIDKLKNDTGFEPEISIDEAILELADYLKNQ